jgi:hypothetical protein
VFSLAVVFVTLAVGAWVSTWEAIRARRAETRAEQEAASAQAVVDFLDRAHFFAISAQLMRRILVEALPTLVLLAVITQHQGKLDEAETLCRGAIDSSTRVLGPEHRITVANENVVCPSLAS